MTPTQALIAATSAPAETFGLSDRGVIGEGKVANLLLVDGDPSMDLAATRRIANSPVAAPPPSVLREGLISDFATGLDATFGAGWTATTEAIAGGQSEARLSWVAHSAAEMPPGALRVAGETRDGFLFPWAGAMFCPGLAPMAAADLSATKGISFRARGDSGQYALALMATSKGFSPVSTPFSGSAEWARYSATFDQLGLDGSDVTAIMFLCYEKRAFWLELGDVRLL